MRIGTISVLKESVPANPVPVVASSGDMYVVSALRRGNETAFMALVDQYHRSLVHLARIYVQDYAIAEEVVQETWLDVHRGLEWCENRSSLKPWLFRTLINRIKTRGQREGRSIPFAALWNPDEEADEPAVDPDRFLSADHPQWPHQWASCPSDWSEIPEERRLSQETGAVIRAAIEGLPSAQRVVITLRDIEGWTSEEVSNVLEISMTNQGVLLHRARSRVRCALEQSFNNHV